MLDKPGCSWAGLHWALTAVSLCSRLGGENINLVIMMTIRIKVMMTMMMMRALQARMRFYEGVLGNSYYRRGLIQSGPMHQWVLCQDLFR